MKFRTALVTGASGGMGLSLAKHLARDGVEVVLAARRTAELAAAVVSIQAEGGKARYLTLDVADTTTTVSEIRRIDEEMGGLDLIVANAGLGGPRSGKKFSWETISDMCQVNFNGAVATLTAVLPRMLERGRGHLVGMGSVASFTPLCSGAPYCSTKTGLLMFLECLRLDLAGTGVKVTTVRPGFVKTPLTAPNKEPMPFIMECDDAVALILRRLRSAPPTIDFPLPFRAMMQFLGGLPRPFRDFALRKFPTPEEPPMSLPDSATS